MVIEASRPGGESGSEGTKPPLVGDPTNLSTWEQQQQEPSMREEDDEYEEDEEECLVPDLPARYTPELVRYHRLQAGLVARNAQLIRNLFARARDKSVLPAKRRRLAEQLRSPST